MNQNITLHTRHSDLKPKNNEFLCIFNGTLNNISARPAFSKLRSSLISSRQSNEINIANRQENNEETMIDTNQNLIAVNDQAIAVENVGDQIVTLNTNLRIITDEISKFYIDLYNFLNKSDHTKENENFSKINVLENEFESEENKILGINLFSENNKYFTHFKL